MISHHCRSCFFRKTTKPLCPSHGYKEAVLIDPRRSSDLCLRRFPILPSRVTPMTGFRQRIGISTLTAPAARGLSPHSLVQLSIRHALCSATGTMYSLFRQNKKGYGGRAPKRAEQQHNHFGNYSIDHSSSPDSHLKRFHILPSQVAPMTGFRQRIWISMPTVLVNAGIWMDSLPHSLM